MAAGMGSNLERKVEQTSFKSCSHRTRGCILVRGVPRGKPGSAETKTLVHQSNLFSRRLAAVHQSRSFHYVRVGVLVVAVVDAVVVDVVVVVHVR